MAASNERKTYDIDEHNELARRAARESAVLLKRGCALPADKSAKVAVVGAFGKTPRYQGAGSSKINPHKVTGLCDALDRRGISYTYAPGYEAEVFEPYEALINEAVRAAEEADVVFACVGLPDSYESEGFDRIHLEMPESQKALMDALAATGKPIVAVVSTGSAIVLPWRDKVDSILLRRHRPRQIEANRPKRLIIVIEAHFTLRVKDLHLLFQISAARHYTEVYRRYLKKFVLTFTLWSDIIKK